MTFGLIAANECKVFKQLNRRARREGKKLCPSALLGDTHPQHRVFLQSFKYETAEGAKIRRVFLKRIVFLGEPPCSRRLSF